MLMPTCFICSCLLCCQCTTTNVLSIVKSLPHPTVDIYCDRGRSKPECPEKNTRQSVRESLSHLRDEHLPPLKRFDPTHPLNLVLNEFAWSECASYNQTERLVVRPRPVYGKPLLFLFFFSSFFLRFFFGGRRGATLLSYTPSVDSEIEPKVGYLLGR